MGSSLSASAKEFVPMSSPQPPSTLNDDSIYETRSCARCNKLYTVFKDTGECCMPEPCVYHWANLGAPHESIHVVVDESRLIPVDVKPHLLTFGVEFCTRYPVNIRIWKALQRPGLHVTVPCHLMAIMGFTVSTEK